MALSRIILPNPPNPANYTDNSKLQTDNYTWATQVQSKVQQLSVNANIDSTQQESTIASLGAIVTVDGSGNIVLQSPAATTPILFEQGGTTRLTIDATGNIVAANKFTAAEFDGPVGTTTPATGAFTTISGAHNGTVGATTPTTGSFTSLSSTSGAFNGTVGAATPSTGSFTSLSSTSGGLNGTVGATTPTTGSFTSLSSTSGALNGTVGAVTPSTGAFSTLITNSAAGITLANALSNLINFGTHGLGAPTTTTRSVGTKIVLYNALSSTSTDYAIGMDSFALWQSCPTGAAYYWYINTTQQAILNSSGFTVAGNIYPGSISGGFVCKQGNTGPYGTHTFGIDWTGTVANLWIDTLNIGSITVSSDAAVKHQIAPITDGLDRVMNLKPISYRHKDVGIFKDDGISREGFVAQDVETVIPSAVNHGDVKSLNPMPILANAIRAIQQLTERVAALEAVKETT